MTTPSVNNKYLHISYLPTSANWLLTILSRLNSSSSTTLRSRFEAWGESPLKEMGFALSTKLDMLSQVTMQIKQSIQALEEQLDTERIIECLNRDAAYSIPDKRLPYKILVDIESFIFETRSSYEIVGRFIREFSNRILELKVDEKEIKKLFDAQNIDTRWIEELRKNRIMFFHKTAPWIALFVKSIEPLEYEIVILKQDMQVFDNPENFFHFEHIKNIATGFIASMNAINNWALTQIEEFEKKQGT